MDEDQSRDMMDGLSFQPFYINKQNGGVKRVYYRSKTGDFLNNELFKRRTKSVKPVELLGTHPHYRLPPRLDLHQYTRCPKTMPQFAYRGIAQFSFDPKWKNEKVINSLPALGCNKQHMIGTVSFTCDKENQKNSSDYYVCVYLCKSDRSIVYQAKRNKRDGFPLVFSQFGFKQKGNSSVLTSEIKLQPKSQALDDNGKHAQIFCVIELWKQLVKLDQVESDPFFTHSEDRRKKSNATTATTPKSDSISVLTSNTTTTTTSSSTTTTTVPGETTIPVYIPQQRPPYYPSYPASYAPQNYYYPPPPFYDPYSSTTNTPTAAVTTNSNSDSSKNLTIIPPPPNYYQAAQATTSPSYSLLQSSYPSPSPQSGSSQSLPPIHEQSTLLLKDEVEQPPTTSISNQKDNQSPTTTPALPSARSLLREVDNRQTPIYNDYRYAPYHYYIHNNQYSSNSNNHHI
jgi:hypothetical protein